MDALVVVDLEPCLDPVGLECCGDSVALEVLAHHRCLSAQAGSSGSAVGLRPGTVGAQLAQKRSLTPIKTVEISILVFERESQDANPMVFIVKESQRFFADSDEIPHRCRCISRLVCFACSSSSFSSSHPAADRHVSPVLLGELATA